MATVLDAHQRIFAINPDHRRAFEALEEHFFTEANWQDLVQLYRARLAAPSIEASDEQRVPLLLRLGQIVEERIVDLDQATEIYWTVARLDPSHRPALRQLRGIHERRAKWDIVIQIAELEGQTSMEPLERAEFEAELGRVWQERLHDPAEALQCFERALEADPELPGALQGLAQLHQDAGRLSEARQLFEKLTERLRGPERAPAWIALGALFAGPLENPARARECFRAALEDDPFQAPAVEWSLLLATASEDWEAVSELLECHFDLASGARARSAIAVEASQIQLNHLRSSASARAWIDRALELSPEEPSVLMAATDVERADGDKDTLLTSLDRLIDVVGRQTPRSALLEAAELHADLGHADRALEAIEWAAERSGTKDERILLLQARLLRTAGSKHRLAEVLETLTSVEGEQPRTRRAAQFRELATLQEEEFNDSDAAETSWRQAFDLEPGEGPALAALDRCYRKREDWDELRAVLERAHDVAGEASAPELSARLAEILLDRFEETGRARVLFEAALAMDERCTAAITGLRRLADASDDPDLLLQVCELEADDCHEADAMGALANTAVPILIARGELKPALEWAVRWSDLPPLDAEALGLRADIEAALERPAAELASRRSLARLQAGSERVATLRRLGDLHRELGQGQEAAVSLDLAREEDPDSLEIIEALCAVYREFDRPHELARTLSLLLEQLAPEQQAEPLEELASTLQAPIGDLDAAIDIRWQLVELPSPPRQAADKLAALLEMAGRYAELSRLLGLQRKRLSSTEELFSLDLRRARLLLDPLGRSDEASAILSTLIEQEPGRDDLLALQERALRGKNDPEALCALLEIQAERAPNDARWAEIQFERASLTEDSLGDLHTACDLYEAILHDLDDAPAAEAAGRRFESLLESTQQWGRLRDRLLTRASALPPAEQATLREQIAHLCRDRLEDIVSCAEQLELVAALARNRVHVWQQLAEIYGETLDRPRSWLRVIEAELATAPAADRELGLRVNAARICLDPARRPESHDESNAYAHYERALAIDPAHAEAAQALATRFEEEGRYADAAELLRAQIDQQVDSTTTIAHELRVRLGRVLAGPLDDEPQAQGLFETALDGLGPVPLVAGPLADLYERLGDRAALSDLARAVLARDEAEGAAAKPEWSVRLGASEYALGHLGAAAVAYRSALAASPDDSEVEDALIEIYERAEEVEPLAALLEKRLPFVRREESSALRLRLAHLYGTRTEDLATGLGHLEQVLDDHPQHEDAFTLALQLAEQLGDPDQMLGLLDRALATSLPDGERANLFERRARLLTDALDRPEEAVLSLREALAIDPKRTSARHALRDRLEQLGRWTAVLDDLVSQARTVAPEERAGIFEEAAEIASTRIGSDASLPWLARLREERPDDPQLLNRIAHVHQESGRFEAALHALDQELALRETDAERLALHLQRAQLLEHALQAPSRAIQAYRDALTAADEEVDDVLVELDRLFDATDRPEERAEVLEARLAFVQEPSLLSDLRRNVAQLYCERLGQPERAISHLEQNVERSRSDPPRDEMAALGALGDALQSCGQRAEWLVVGERQIECIEADPTLLDGATKDFHSSLRAELARVWDETMGDAERALVHLRALRLHPDPDPPDDQLLDLLRRTGRRAELAGELTRHLEAGKGTSETWLELARLREEVLADLRGAHDAYQEAQADRSLRLDAIRGRRRTSERLHDWEAMAQALEDEYRLKDLLGRDERTALARRLGDLCWHRLSSGDRAANAYWLALDLDPHDLQALRSLIDVKEARNQAEGAITLYRSELEILPENSDTAARRREIWLRLSTLLLQENEDPAPSIEALREAEQIGRLEAKDELRLARLLQRSEDLREFCATFEAWCDRADSDASVQDHLELAEALLETNEPIAARQRCERATQIAPDHADAWRLRAELDLADGALEGAAEAFELAGGHAPPTIAAAHFLAAAECVLDEDLDRAHALLGRATELDPASLPAHLARARTSADLNRPLETAGEAERVLDLARVHPLPAEERVEMALLGGRAARALCRRESSRAFFEQALEIDPEQSEALESIAAEDFEDGHFQAARGPLERRLQQPGEHPDRARLLGMVGRCIEEAEDLDAAGERYAEAIECDERLEMAHEGLVRVLERQGRPADALSRLERWSEVSAALETRARTAYRGAEHALSLEQPDTALRLLTRATETDPSLSPAWVLLCELASEHAPEDEARAHCQQALAALEAGPLAAPVALRAAQLAERAGDVAEARRHYADASRWEPLSTEAVLCESRLVRMSGDWNEAHSVLQGFLERHPEPESPGVAHIHLERGRLLSGPLEDFASAIRAYEKALALQPRLEMARMALAGLLLHTPARSREALDMHRAILADAPTHVRSLRALVQLGEQHRDPTLADSALSVLVALGLASPQERASAPKAVSFKFRSSTALPDPGSERLRRVAQQLGDELHGVVHSAATARATSSDEELDAALAQIAKIEDELSVPGLARIAPEDRAMFFASLSRRILKPESAPTNRRFAAELERALGRKNRRKVRRLLEETDSTQIEGLDQSAWGEELRVMAATRAVERGSPLGPVLRALLLLDPRVDEGLFPEDAEIAIPAASCESTRRLLVEIQSQLCDRLSKSR